MDNSLHFKPDYTGHRRALTAADAAVNAAFVTAFAPGAFNAGGYDSIEGFVRCGAGDVTIEVLELVKFKDADGTAQQRFVVRGSAIGPLTDGTGFAFDTPGGGRFFLRASAVTTGPADIFIAGGTRANEGSI